MTRTVSTLTFALMVPVLAGCSDGGDGGDGMFTLRGSGTLGSGSQLQPRANTGLSPEVFKTKVHGFSLSLDGDCSDPITVLDEADPEPTDLMENPTIWQGTVPDGSYPCVILEIGDNLEFAPAESSDDGFCVQGETQVRDVCHGKDDNGFQSLDGSMHACEDAPQRVALYISTWATPELEANPFWPPQSEGDAQRGLHLDGEFVVEGDTVGTFVIDATGRVQSSGDHCELLPPTFAFY